MPTRTVSKKVCAGCDTRKPVNEYYLDKRGTPLRYCKKCHNKRSTERRRERRSSISQEELARLYKRDDLIRRYGITLEEYEQMLETQGGVCAICRRTETEMLNDRVKTLAVDHCHETGAVRGLLCSACNIGIGRLNDSIELLQAAVLYLLHHKKNSVNRAT